MHVRRVGAPLATESLEIRAQSLADHQALRRATARLRERVQGCDCAALPYPTGEAIATLLDRLRAHLDDEDATLGPMLQHIDPWGPVRAAQHEERRRVERARIAELLTREPASASCPRIRSSATLLRLSEGDSTWRPTSGGQARPTSRANRFFSCAT
ncbi:MAG TPA: hypothetical protein VN947_23315 [Polyangia bacterium]|nr:hypothetical protein [Polyangia bacterium]